MFPESMTAIEIAEPGDASVLRVVMRPVPVPRHDQILIRVAWAGVNRPDVLQRRGLYAAPPEASDLPGLEVSGEIVGMGVGVTRWRKGEQVCALVPGGGYAGYVACHGDHALRIPYGLTLRQGACLPETAFTVWSNVVTRGRLTGGERFLVHGGSSGIGTMAIQVARSLGARVFATAGSDTKCAAVAALGAVPVNYRTDDFVRILSAEGGADLILDMVGGDYVGRNLRALAPDGRLVMIGTQQGARVEVNLSDLMTRRLSVTGSTLRPQSDAAKAEIADTLRKRLWPLLSAGTVKVSIDSEFDLTNAADAHRRMESSQHIGKIVLRVGDDPD